MTILWPAVSVWVVFKGRQQEKVVVVAAWILDLLYPLLLRLAGMAGANTGLMILAWPAFSMTIQAAALIYVTVSFYQRQERLFWQIAGGIAAMLHSWYALNALRLLLTRF